MRLLERDVGTTPTIFAQMYNCNDVIGLHTQTVPNHGDDNTSASKTVTSVWSYWTPERNVRVKWWIQKDFLYNMKHGNAAISFVEVYNFQAFAL